MNGFVAIGLLFIGLVKWHKSKDLSNKLSAVALSLSAAFLIVRFYVVGQAPGPVGFEIIFVYALCFIIYFVNLVQSKDLDD